MSLADWLRLAYVGAWVVMFFAAMRSCGALEAIAHELRRSNDHAFGPELDAGGAP